MIGWAKAIPKLVEELVPKILSLGEVQKVLQQLLREQVSIRDLSTILEALLDASAINKNAILLVEAARQSLGRALVRPLLAEDGGLRVLTLDHNIEEELNRAFSPQAPVATAAGLQPSFVRRILDGLRALAGDQVGRLRRCCCVRPRRATICGACSNRFFRRWWCFRRWRFLP